MDKIAANEHAWSSQPTRKNGSGKCMIGREGAERGLGVAGKGGGNEVEVDVGHGSRARHAQKGVGGMG